MENKSTSLKKHIFKYGGIFGLASILFSFSIYLAGHYTEQGLFHLIVRSVIPITIIITGLIVFKNKNNNYISLGEALKIGVGVSLLGGLIVILWNVLLIQVIDLEIIDQINEKHFKKIAKTSTDITQENINRKIAITKKYTSPLVMIGVALAENTFLGFLISLIGGLIIRKKRDPFN